MFRRGGTIKYIVDGHRRYILSISTRWIRDSIFEMESLQVCNKTEWLICASLAVTSTEYPEASTKCGEKPSEHTIGTGNSNNEAEMMVPVASIVLEQHTIDMDQISCTSVKS